MKKTKIVATLGPATANYKMMLQLARAGVNVFRMNFSHGDYGFFTSILSDIKKLRKAGFQVAALQDLQGPKIRVGKIPAPITVKKGTEVAICDKAVKGIMTIPIDVKGLYKYVKRGNKILINDGMIELRVKEIKASAVICSVIEGGEVQKRKGVNLPGIILPISSMTVKDKKDLIFGIKNGVDIVCLSFVRHAKDMISLKAQVNKLTKKPPLLIAKIEKPEAVKDIENIIDSCDGIMAARGDLAVEAGYENVPGMQKKITAAANVKGKIIIMATQMLESMIENPYPHRSEMTDIYNAVTDGADALMLSGETSVGKHPVKAVNVMSNIAEKAESAMNRSHSAPAPAEHSCGTGNYLAYCSALAPHFVKQSVIVAINAEVMQYSLISDYKPEYGILAVCSDESACRKTALLRGVYPTAIKKISDKVLETEVKKIYPSAKAAVTADFTEKTIRVINFKG